MHISKVIDGLSRYIDKHIFADMNGLQQVGYLTLLESLKAGPETLSDFLSKNIFIRMLISSDKDGDINVERIITGLRKVVAKNGKVVFDIPMYGSFTLTNEDITEILRNMSEEVNHEINT